MAVERLGEDILNSVDNFYYTYFEARGNVVAEFLVDRFEDVYKWSKAGEMIRDTLDTGSHYCSVFVTGSHGIIQ